MEVAVGDRGSVDLRLEHHALHALATSVGRARRRRALGARALDARRSRSSERVVDQPHRADAAPRQQQASVGRARSDRPKRLGSTSSRYSGSTSKVDASLRVRSGEDAARSARRRGQPARRARPAKRALALALSLVEQAVAARQASPSRSRTVGQHLDAHGDVEVLDEPADDERLLGVLLTEVGDVGPTMLSSFVTTVATPLKCAAPREAPSSGSVRPRTSTLRREAVGVDLRTAGAKSRSAPAAARSSASRSSFRG